MTNLEVIAKEMTKHEQAPLFSLVCRYWMETKSAGCNDCPLRYRCDMEPMMEDADMEAWLKEDAGSYESLGNVIRLLETVADESEKTDNMDWIMFGKGIQFALSKIKSNLKEV